MGPKIKMSKRGRKPSQVVNYIEDNSCKFCGQKLSENTTVMKRHFNDCESCPQTVRLKLIIETKKNSHKKSNNLHKIEDQQFNLNVSLTIKMFMFLSILSSFV